MQSAEDFEQIILTLILSKREGQYWDFKEDPHQNTASLLHDIISLANGLHNGNKYLIMGVSDPSDGCKIKGLTQNQLNRKTQVQYIDFLRTQKFAGDNRPVIELRTVEINGFEIDVLIVFDLPLKPHYLSTSYRDKDKEVRANYIYTRTNDTNTPIDKSADIGVIEKMWWQRFKLDLPPLERMKHLLLEPDNWSKDVAHKKYMSHRQFPEYTVELSEVERFDEPYSYFFTNEASFLGNAVFKYHSTILFEYEYMYCDEMRIILPVPENAYLELQNDHQWYYYYMLSDISGIFLTFLTDKRYDFTSRGSGAPFLVFKNLEAKQSFDQYAITNQEEINKIDPQFWAEHAVKRIKQAGREYSVDPLFLDRMKQLYHRWVLKTI